MTSPTSPSPPVETASLSDRQRLTDKLGFEQWDNEIVARFALERIEALEAGLRPFAEVWRSLSERTVHIMYPAYAKDLRRAAELVPEDPT